MVSTRAKAKSNSSRSSGVNTNKNSAKKSVKIKVTHNSNRPRKEEALPDMFGYGNLFEVVKDLADSCEPMMQQMGIDAKKMSGKSSGKHNHANSTAADSRSFGESLASSARMAQEQVKGMGDVRHIVQEGMQSFMDAQKDWFAGTSRNFAGLLKDVMKSGDNQDKLDSMYSYLLSQMDTNHLNATDRIKSRYMMLSALIATQDGHAMGFARNTYDSMMAKPSTRRQ